MTTPSNSSNLLALSYRSEAEKLRRLPYPIIDIHSHIHGHSAARLYAEVATLFGIKQTYTMTVPSECEGVRSLLSERIEFIATPDFRDQDRLHAFGRGFIENLPLFSKLGARIAKFWAAPRILDATAEPYLTNPLRLNAPLRLETMRAAVDAGMICMAHVADPDTWFATKYAEHTKYGRKDDHYEAFEEVLERFPVPWIAAHFGGSPEDLTRLSRLLERHSNLYLDCSATKWMVRELSKHPVAHTRQFFTRWKGRVLFGSDIVTSEAHLSSERGRSEMDTRAASHQEAFDLYASRYWALRTLLESSYDGPSPIADPDLALVDPAQFHELDAPHLRGCALPDDVLEAVYCRTAQNLLGGG